MELKRFEKIDEFTWQINQQHNMQVPAIIYATEQLIRDMDDKVYEQISNVASLPGIVRAAYAMPDAHWGYGFPIGGVAAFDAEQGGVVSAGGVGFDISCGVRLLKTGLTKQDIEPVKEFVADALFAAIPAGVGSRSAIRLTKQQMEKMLIEGAKWAVKQGFGEKEDLEYIEEQGSMPGAIPDYVSEQARKRQESEMGTLGSGNHYLEVQEVSDIFDENTARQFGLAQNEIVISIHCGSRGLGHQIGTEFLRSMTIEAQRLGIHLPERELACAPLQSDLGRRYLGAMRAAINCALANRQIITHFARNVFQQIFPGVCLKLLYDVSHNTCKEETHLVNGKAQKLFVHRKGATRAFGPQHQELPPAYFNVGQPVIIGGSMGTSSYVLVGTKESEEKSFSSACHGAGRAMSRNQALKQWKGKNLIAELQQQGILIRSISLRGVAEEAPNAYKDVREVVEAADVAGLAKKVAKLKPLICVKG